MSHVGNLVRAWRSERKLSEQDLAERAGLPLSLLEAIESERVDPPHSTLAAVAMGLQIPLAWLVTHPSHIELLCGENDDDSDPIARLTGVDPVLERILLSAGHDRSLYVLLTALLQNGDPKLLRAAEVSLRSLVKQLKQATVPWQSRPPGHFEPPSD